MDPAHVRGRRPPQGRARRGERVRLHAGQSRGAAPGAGDGRAGAHRGGEPAAQPRLHAERGLSRSARDHRAPACATDRPALQRGAHPHDRGFERRHQHGPEGDARSGRRSDGAGAVLPRVQVLYREPRGAHRSGRDHRKLPAGFRAHRRGPHAAHEGAHPEFTQ